MGRPCADCVDPEVLGCQCSEDDSDTVSVSGDGSGGNPFVHSVKVSADANNAVVAEGDGIYVPSDEPLCRADRTGGEQVIAKNTDTWVIFDHTVISNDSMHSGTVQPEQMNFNSAGVYAIGACVSFDELATATRCSVFIRVNGSLIIASQQLAPLAAHPTNIIVATMWQFQIGDFFQVGMFHDNGTDVNSRNFADYSPVMWAFRVST